MYHLSVALSALGTLVASQVLPVPTRIVHIDSGPIRGYEENGLEIFKGIPFAEPPTGDNRWKNPQPVKSWKLTKDCFTQGHICTQFDVVGTPDTYLGREDCLYLDVYKPKKPVSQSLPVLFWIYGGGYSLGDQSEFGDYDPRTLVEKHGYIFVGHNYRVGALGFLATEELAEEDPNGSFGNQGVLDQRAAMQWVQRNIKKFGGDPSRVTIMGESAGGMSVCFHAGSPASKGLFHGAIMESGTCDDPNFFKPPQEALSWGKLWADSHGCLHNDKVDLKCLRKLPTRTAARTPADLHGKTKGMFLPRLYPVFPWSPTVDMSKIGLMGTPLSHLQNGTGSSVPFIGGFNNDEGVIFVPAMPLAVPGVSLPLNKSKFVTVLDHFFCSNSTLTSQIIDNYHIENYRSYDSLANFVLRDYFFACATRRAHRVMAEKKAGQNFMYHFNFSGHTTWDKYEGDIHGSELAYVFGHDWPFKFRWDANDEIMSQTIQNYWTNMVTQGNVNGGFANVEWPSWEPINATMMQLKLNSTKQVNFLQQTCDMFDQLKVECKANGCNC